MDRPDPYSSTSVRTRDRLARPRERRIGAVAAALAACLAAGPADAQSMQSLNDRLTQLQASLTAFATSTTTLLNSMAGKIDAIVANVVPPATPVPLATGMVSKADPFLEAACAVVNAGDSSVTLTIRMLDFQGNTVASKVSTLLPNTGDGIVGGGLIKTSVWCRFEPSAAGARLRGSISLYRLADITTVLHADAR